MLQRQKFYDERLPLGSLVGTAGWVMNRKQDVKRFSQASPERHNQSISLNTKMNVDPLELYCLLMAGGQEWIWSLGVRSGIQYKDTEDPLLSYCYATCIGYAFT